MVELLGSSKRRSRRRLFFLQVVFSRLKLLCQNINSRPICPNLTDSFRAYLGVILPKAQICHYILQQLLQIIGIRSSVPPIAILVFPGRGKLPHYFQQYRSRQRGYWSTGEEMGFQFCSGVCQLCRFIEYWFSMYYLHRLFLMGYGGRNHGYEKFNLQPSISFALL